MTTNDVMHTIPQQDGYQTGGADVSAFKLFKFITIGNVLTEPIFVGNMRGYSVVLSCPATGGPSGTVKLQGSNDHEIGFNGRADGHVVNWFDVAATSGDGRTVTLTVTSSGGTFHLTDPFCRYRWMRVSYIPSGGSITATVTVQGKA